MAFFALFRKTATSPNKSIHFGTLNLDFGVSLILYQGKSGIPENPERSVTHAPLAQVSLGPPVPPCRICSVVWWWWWLPAPNQPNPTNHTQTKRGSSVWHGAHFGRGRVSSQDLLLFCFGVSLRQGIASMRYGGSRAAAGSIAAAILFRGCSGYTILHFGGHIPPLFSAFSTQPWRKLAMFLGGILALWPQRRYVSQQA